MDPQAESPQQKPFEARLADLNARIKQDLESEAVGYDRRSVLQPGYTDVIELDREQNRAVLGLPSLAAITQSYKDQDAKGIQGTCRDVAPFTTWKYKEDGLLDEAETYSCADNGEFHYVTVGEIAGKEVICDLGYNVPLREAIPVHATVPAQGEGWMKSQIMINGKMMNVLCRAIREEDEVSLQVWDADNVESPKYLKSFNFKKVDNNRDRETAIGWLGVTDNPYRMDTQGKRIPLSGEEAPLVDQFKAVHQIATSTGGQVEILLRDKMEREGA